MNDPDHQTEAYKLLSIVHRFHRTHQRPPTTADVAKELFDRENIADNKELESAKSSLEELRGISYLTCNDAPSFVDRDTKWSLDNQGQQFLRNASLTEQLEMNRNTNERLVWQEKKSSVVETVFTIALLTFSFVQISYILLDNLSGGNLLAAFTGGTTLFATALLYAWKIGKDNIQEVNEELNLVTISESNIKFLLFSIGLLIGIIAGLRLAIVLS